VPGIFISYRRGDSIGHTGRLYDLLSRHFGKSQIFMDIDAIGPGEDFVEVIDKTCQSCEVLLAVIGRSWTTIADEGGKRRLDDSGDFVRLEIGRALEKGVRVVPVLVDGAQMPDAATLPSELKKLALRNAWEINDKRFHHDVKQLVEALQKMQPALQPLPTSPENEPVRSNMPAAVTGQGSTDRRQGRFSWTTVFAGIGAIVVLAALSVAYFGWFKPAPATASTPLAQNGPGGTSYIPSLQARVTAPLLFFLYQPGSPMLPPGQRPYGTVFHSADSSGKQIFWEVSLNFLGQFPPPDYQIESVWYRDSKEVFRGVRMYKGSEVTGRSYHNRFAWTPPAGRLPEGQYRVELDVGGKQITSGDFSVQP